MLENFVKAIIADPRDDQARLVFGDYLEENGDPRAELIRLQFQLTEMSRFDKSRPKLRKRELQLLKEHGGFGRVPAVVKVLDTHGGFVDAIELTVTRFLKYQDEIFADAPIRKVVLKSKSKKFDKLRESRHLPQLASIGLVSNHASNAELVRFVSDAALNNLHELDIYAGEPLSLDLARAIADSAALSQLRELSLANYHEHGAEAVAAIAASSSIASLQSLALGGQNDDSLSFIGDSPFFRSLKSLSINGVITGNGVCALQNGMYCRELEKLRVRSYSFRGRGKNVFDVERPLANLRHLEIGTGLSTKILIDICNNYPKLEVLELSDNVIDDSAMRVLAESPLLANLKKLSLSRNRITKTGMYALANSSHRNKSLKLNLRSNRISFGDAEELKRAFGRTFGSLPKEAWHYR